MTYLVLGTSLALAAFLAVDLIASSLTAAVWRAARGNLDRVGARSRAGGLFLLRVFPTTAAVIVVLGVLLPAFCRFEPRETGEIVGPSLAVLALASAGLILAGLRRGWQAARATRRIERRWMETAHQVILPGIRARTYSIAARFPVVSLVGVARPRLFVSERVLRECNAEEVAAMVRHECGHLASGDNLKRLVLRLCPSALLLTSFGRAVERCWQEACEEAADDYAAAASTPGGLALANALLHVARMAPAGAVAIGGATLYAGDSIERRVKRLIDNDPGGRSAAWLLATRALALIPPVLAIAVLLDANLLHTVHHVIEAVVETLP